VLADERASLIRRWQKLTTIGEQAQGSHVRAQRVVGNDGFCDLVGALRADAGIQVISPVATGPPIEPVLLHRRQIVGDEVCTNLAPSFTTAQRPPVAGLKSLMGAPVGMAEDGDGAQLFADDVGDVVWRVSLAAKSLLSSQVTHQPSDHTVNL